MNTQSLKLNTNNYSIIEDDNELDNLLEPYKSNEYLPINIIDKLIKMWNRLVININFIIKWNLFNLNFNQKK
jgi:hypothetical protein